MTSTVAVERLDELNHFTRRLVEFRRTNRVEHYRTPTNRGALKASYLRDHDPSRRLDEPEYRTVPDALVEQLDELARDVDAASPGGFWWELLQRDVTASARNWRAYRHRTPDAIHEASLAAHGAPTPATVAAAEARLAQPRTPEGDSTEPADVSATDAAEVLAAALRAAELDWSTEVSTRMNARMSVSSAERVVRIRDDARFTASAVTRLLVHEIETHVYRSANGAAQPIDLLAYGFGSYLPAEEGLAVWHEDRARATDEYTMRKYAVRVVAADMTARVGFSELFAFAADHLLPDDAFELALRAKRGSPEPERPGGDVKDHVYLTGYLAVSELLGQRPEVHTTLMVGKVGLEWLETIQDALDAAVLSAPKYLPRWASEPTP